MVNSIETLVCKTIFETVLRPLIIKTNFYPKQKEYKGLFLSLLFPGQDRLSSKKKQNDPKGMHGNIGLQ